MINLNILIPTYYYDKGLVNIFNSIGTTNAKNNIIINIFDNTKNDKIYRIYSKNLNKFKYINYFFNIPTLNATTNWNRSLKYLENKYFISNPLITNYYIILHQDEFLCRDFFLNLTKIIKNNNYPDVISCDTLVFNKYKIFNKIHTTSWQRQFIHKYRLSYMILRNYIGPTSSLIIKLKKKNLKFSFNFKWLLDVEYYLRLSSETNKWLFTSSIFVFSDQNNKYALTRYYSKDIALLYKKESKLLTNIKTKNSLLINKLFDLPLWIFIRIFNKLIFFLNYKKYST